MLVYLKNPMAYSKIDGKRIYGRKYAYGSFGPTEINIESFKANIDSLEEAEYTKEWLENKYKTSFPSVSFKLKNLSTLTISNLVAIAHGIGIKFHRGRTIKPHEKKALYTAIRKRLC